MLDENAKLFAQSAAHLARNQGEMISIKVTALADMKLLKRMNDSVLVRDKFWA